MKYKGLEDLISVYNKISKNKRKIRLYLAGNFIPDKWYGKIFNFTNNIDRKLINSKNIINLGHLDNIQNFYERIDIICFPSYLNALGRPVFEAGLYNIPSIVCLKKEYADSFINKKTGLSFKKPGDLKKLQNIINYFYLKKKQIQMMGKNANKLIKKNHSVQINLNKLKNIYSESIKNTKK